MGNRSQREIDDNGFLLVKECPVSSFGIFEYAAWQVGIEDGDPDRIVKVYRPESEISNPEAIESFQMVPFIDEHDLLSGFEDDDDVMSPEEKGVDGVMFNVHYAAPWLRADVKAFTRRMQRAINSGKVELSLGYGCDFVLKSGVFDGQAYEVMQINMRGNHLALVDAARVEGAKVLDSKVAFDCLSFHKPQVTKDSAMGAKTANKGRVIRAKVGDSSAVEKLKALIPALQQFLKEESAEPEHQEGAVEGNAEVSQAEGGAEAAQTVPAEGEDNADLREIIAQVEAIIAELKGEAGAQDSEGEEGKKAEDSEGEENGQGEVGAQDSEGEEGKKAEDSVEGLAGKSSEDCEGNGSASRGPAGGKHVGDAAIRRSIYADIDRKNRLYDRVSPIIGAFDHALMTSEDMAAYAAKKLKINAPKGMASVALDSYLSGVERSKVAPKTTTTVGDSAFGDFDPIDSYLQGSK